MDIFLANLGLIGPFTVLMVSVIGMMIYVAIRPRMLINRMLRECRNMKADEVVDVLIKAGVLCGDEKFTSLRRLKLNCSPDLLGEVMATWLNQSAFADHVAYHIVKEGWSEKRIARFLSGMKRHPLVQDAVEIGLNVARQTEISDAAQMRRKNAIYSGLRAAGYRYERKNEEGGEEDDLIR